MQMQSLEKMVTAFIKGVKDAFAVLIGVCIIVFIGALVFRSIFKNWACNGHKPGHKDCDEEREAYVKENWGSLRRSLLSCFIIMTDGWEGIYKGADIPIEVPTLAKMAILTLVFVLGICMMGLLDAVFVDALQQARTEKQRQKEEKRQQVSSC